ncbi:MAG: DUF3368 domain-containing protein [Spirochaetaceae bacterium]|nr:DUF3368 domain-containing protein [Spirochaetaceae bacterium]
MTVVADASPLIFLGKIRRLVLIRRVRGDDVVVPQQIREEVLARPLDHAESVELHRFLAAARVERVDSPRAFAAGMSRADNAAMTLAVRLKAGLLLTDDRTVRRLATVEGIRPLGTLGVLLLALRGGLVDRAEVRRLIDDLVRSHGFRIGVELYAAVICEIDATT